ncbi:helix-turn-helix domain-containing protein [Aquiflexum sp. LQ15W]|uniref:helix-turn-helix domain-containing protein n=1 Tax=Cognataquiflexum nitidum TaxID=2922272 RepID=UPI001F14962D|nr:helix-turn-helix domain-containing protein [Cognataquiflexum nitidum]MCH6199985.1 helix-turn-helix domain-containing protein [Cognataquiflexum nitidum]
MDSGFDFNNLFFLVSVVIGLQTGVIVMVYSLRKNKKSIPLALTFLSLSLAIFFSMLISSGMMVHLPGIYRIGNIFGLIFVPMPFIYMQCVTQNRNLRWSDAFHLIPVAIYIIDYSPVLFLSSAEKLELILQDINDPNRFTEFRQSMFFPDGFHQTFRTILINIYWLMQVGLLVKWQKNINRPFNKFEKEWRVWIIFFMSFQFFLFLPFYMTYFWLDKELVFMLVHFTGAVLLMSSAVLLYFFPQLLYGLDEIQFVADQIIKMESYPKTEKSGIQPDDKMKELGPIILDWMDEKKVYLNQRYSIQDFARDTNIPYYQLSACINHYLNTNFADLLNKKRIEYSIELLQKGEFSNYTLEALSGECGFNNRNSFVLAFKKFTGTTPSNFRKNLTK